MNTPVALRTQDLRRRAAAIAKAYHAEVSRSDTTLTPMQALKVLHELRVRQIELEMQNEELQRLQRELDAERERYRDLYDMAPVGYLRVSEKGLILQTNLNAATALSQQPGQLLQQPFTDFVVRTDQDTYHLLRQRLLATRQTQACELQMRPKEGPPIWAALNASLVQKDTCDGDEIRIALSDISQHKRAELAMAASEHSLRISQRQTEMVQRLSATGSWIYNLATEEIWGSAEGMRIYGYAPVAGSFPIGHFEACLAEQDRKRVHESLESLIHDGGLYDLEFSVMPADGSPARRTHSLAILESDAQGKPLLVLGFVQDITKSRMMEEQVRQMAFMDPLTGLPNRRLLLDRLEQALAASRRVEDFGALMFLDLDNFKPLNDQHGHRTGDLLLVEVARRLRACVRATDTVSRIGGDEFVVLLSDLTRDQGHAAEQASNIAEKICVALAQTYVLAGSNKLERTEHQCSASIGVVLIGPQHQNVEELLKWADATMYRAKEQGRNRFLFMMDRRAKQRP